MATWSIEAYYNGVKFRSRTEARWAVMFNEARIDFQYEPEGFNFGKEKYVPDFWIPSWDSYLEIKRDGFEIRRGEWKRERCVCEMLNEETGKDVYLAPGNPSGELVLYHWQSDRVKPKPVYLPNLVRMSCILTAKNHRFDWKPGWRTRPRRIYDGEGAIGILATDILKNMRKE